MVDKVRKVAVGWPACILSVFWLVWFSQTDVAARIHGNLFPVVTPLTVTSAEPALIGEKPATRLQGFADIKRESCDFIRVEWWLEGENRRVAVPAFFADEATVRSKGRQKWNALMVGVTPDQLGNTTGDARHKCGRFPALTAFYAPDTSMIPTAEGAAARCVDGTFTTSTGPGTCSGHGGIDEWLE